MLNLDKLQAAFPLLKQLLALSIPHAHTVAAVGAILDGIEAATAEDYTKNPLQAAAAGLAVIGAEVSQALAPASPVQAVPAPAPVSLS